MSFRFILLLACSIVPYTIGNGIVPLVPVYALRLGVSPAFAGYLLAGSYTTLAIGTLLGGWVSSRWRRHKLPLVCSAVLIVPGVWMMGVVSSPTWFAVFISLTWLLAGFQVVTVDILTGLTAKAAHRGASFGFVGLAPGIGSLLGGLASGPITDTAGYGTMFIAFAMFAATLIVLSLLVQEPRYEAIGIRGSGGKRNRAPAASVALSFANGALGVALFVGILLRSVRMDQLGFSATYISVANALTGALSIPLVIGLGALSDWLGRRRLLVLACATGAAMVLMFGAGTQLWHFLVASVLLAVTLTFPAVGNAFVTDLFPKQTLGRAISMFTASRWAGGIVGYGVGGVTIVAVGTSLTGGIGAALACLTMLVVLSVRRSARRG